MDAIDQHAQRPTVEDKGTEAKVPRSLPFPNPAAIIEGLQTTIIANIKDVIGTLIDEKLDNKLCQGSATIAEDQLSRSYASAIGKDNQVNNFREIMTAAKNEELGETRE